MDGMRDENVLYGLGRIAQLWGVSESTARRWLALPEGECFSVGSMSNAGGGYGHGWYGQITSLHALREIVVARTSEARRAAARAATQPGRRPLPSAPPASDQRPLGKPRNRPEQSCAADS
jgi:hypothetical protein